MLIIDALYGGGAERQNLLLAQMLLKEGWRVTLLALLDVPPVYKIPDDLRYEVLPRHRRLTAVRAAIDVARRLRRLRPNAVISSSRSSDSILAAAGLLVRTDVTLWIHNILRRVPRGAPRYLRRGLERGTFKVVAVTQDGAEEARRVFPAAAVFRVPYGLDADFLDRLTSVSREEGRRKVVLGMGRNVLEKGWDDLIEAFRLSGIHTEGWRLRLVVHETKDLEERFKAAGIATYAEASGWSLSPEVEYARAGIVCVPSHYEGFGLVPLEAMAAGRPVLATRYKNGAEEMIQHGSTGWLADVRNPGSLADHLKEIAALDIEARERVGARARTHATTWSTRCLLAGWLSVLAQERVQGLDVAPSDNG